jgi:hypothetical protein
MVGKEREKLVNTTILKKKISPKHRSHVSKLTTTIAIKKKIAKN